MVETVSPAGEVTRILRDQELPLAERDELGQLLASYVAGDGLLVGREADGEMWCYLHDVQGSVIAFTDNDRNVAASYRYGAFGDLRSETGGVSNKFRYTGAHGLPTDATALVHMGMRSYLPRTGRFLSLDPQRQGVNWYRYGENNPVNYIDPSGEWSEESVNPWLRIAAGISFIAFGIKCLFWGVAALQTFVGFLAVGLPDSMMSLLMFGGALIAGLAGIALGIELIAYGRNLIHGALIEIIDEW
jgi:RHS repeat-associated protein